jgi:hypothetical protein
LTAGNWFEHLYQVDLNRLRDEASCFLEKFADFFGAQGLAAERGKRGDLPAQLFSL